MSRTLRSLPADVADTVSYVVEQEEEEEEQLLLMPVTEVDNVKAIFAGGQKNHTPDYQRVERSESEAGVNSNSSADFPESAQSVADSAAGAGVAGGGTGGLPDGSVDGAVASAVAYDVAGSKEGWMERNPTTVILQQHRSDEM